MNNCCDKCSGRLEDENSFSRNYGCLYEDCTCHSPQSVNDWAKTLKEYGSFCINPACGKESHPCGNSKVLRMLDQARATALQDAMEVVKKDEKIPVMFRQTILSALMSLAKD